MTEPKPAEWVCPICGEGLLLCLHGYISYGSTVDLDLWLKLAEPSFTFWDNENDAIFDEL